MVTVPVVLPATWPGGRDLLWLVTFATIAGPSVSSRWYRARGEIARSFTQFRRFLPSEEDVVSFRVKARVLWSIVRCEFGSDMPSPHASKSASTVASRAQWEPFSPENMNSDGKPLRLAYPPGSEAICLEVFLWHSWPHAACEWGLSFVTLICIIVVEHVFFWCPLVCQ